MAGRLRAKVAIVTGGGTGIGEAICRRFTPPEGRMNLRHTHDGLRHKDVVKFN